MSKKFYGGIAVQNAQEVSFADSDSSNFTAFKAPAALTGNTTFTLPDGDSTGSQALTSNGSGTLSWASYISTTLTSANILVGNGSNVATGVAMSGDIAIDNTGATSIAAGVIVNADINAAAAIEFSKMENLTANRALFSDASGDVTVSAVTDTELGYLDGVTSAIQTQLDGKASTALSNLSVASLAAESLLVGSSASAVSALAAGSEGQVLKIVGGSVAWAADAGSQSFTDDWETADGTSFAVTHSLGTKDVIVQVYDKATDETIEVDSVVRTSTSVVTLGSSVAPGAGSWRVVIIAA